MISSPIDMLVAAVGGMALVGALVVVFSKDVVRMMLGLGAMLVAVAGYFGLMGAAFLAVAEVFVYVGGVLVLFLFAIMLVHRSSGAKPVLESRHDVLAAVISIGIFLMLLTTLAPLVRSEGIVSMPSSAEALADALVGPGLVQFEAVGFLLLASLVAVVSIMGRERK